MGGHNVLALPQGRFAIRADAVRLSAQGTEAVVRGIEYQGGHIALTARALGNQEILALIPEAEFFANPKQTGDSIWLSWTKGSFTACWPDRIKTEPVTAKTNKPHRKPQRGLPHEQDAIQPPQYP